MSLKETESITANFNQKAMESLEGNNFNSALSYLHQADYLLKNKQLTESIIKLKCITLNNLGCVYKRLERHKRALFYLHEALTLGTKFSTTADLACIHLNISAINTLLSYHEEALFHALSGLKLSQKSFVQQSESINTLLSGYYQCGLEYQFLHKTKLALKYFKYGYELACSHLGKNHITTHKFFKALHDKNLKDIKGLKNDSIKFKILQPLDIRKNIHKSHRSEVQSTEPFKANKIFKNNQSYSNSPLNNKGVKSSNNLSHLSNSKKSILNYSPIAQNITSIGNTLTGIKKRLENHKTDAEGFKILKNFTEISFSTPRNSAEKRGNAAVMIQKNLKM